MSGSGVGFDASCIQHGSIPQPPLLKSVSKGEWELGYSILPGIGMKIWGRYIHVNLPLSISSLISLSTFSEFLKHFAHFHHATVLRFMLAGPEIDI
jgi:hypothetical protein